PPTERSRSSGPSRAQVRDVGALPDARPVRVSPGLTRTTGGRHLRRKTRDGRTTQLHSGPVPTTRGSLVLGAGHRSGPEVRDALATFTARFSRRRSPRHSTTPRKWTTRSGRSSTPSGLDPVSLCKILATITYRASGSEGVRWGVFAWPNANDAQTA